MVARRARLARRLHSGCLTLGLLPALHAHAAVLSMRFAGGGNNVTVGPTQTAVIEVLFAMGGSCPKSPDWLSRLDLRFDVGAETINPGVGPFVVDGSTDFTVTSVSTPISGWSTAGTSGVGGPFNGGFFLSAGDPAGLAGPTCGFTQPRHVASITLRKDSMGPGEVKVVFRNDDSVPALHTGTARWINRFGYTTADGRHEFLHGQGSSGDNGPQYAYHGYEAYEPLTIHMVPEPGALAIMLLGTLAILRQPRSERGRPRPGPVQSTGGR